MGSMWGRYVPVGERQAKAAKQVAKLRKAGQVITGVTIKGLTIAKTYWGKAWCDNLESYRDYDNRLPRGRTYVRNGSVVDLQVAPHLVSAMVAGSELYHIKVRIAPLAPSRWKTLCQDCAGGIDSLVELLQGRFSKGVMERISNQDQGLFPKPSEIKFSCSCPDSASMCKHVAAALYGVGARLDEAPELLFKLRGVEAADLIADLDKALPLSKTAPSAGKVLEGGDMAALFGLDMAAPDVPKPAPMVAARAVAKAPAKPTAAAKTPAKSTVIAKTPAKPAAVAKAPAKPAAVAKAPDDASQRKKTAAAAREANVIARTKAAAAKKRDAAPIAPRSSRDATRQKRAVVDAPAPSER